MTGCCKSDRASGNERLCCGYALIARIRGNTLHYIIISYLSFACSRVAFAASSTHTPAKYLDEARKLGQLLADGGHLCINGAGKNGCMGALNDGLEQQKGRVRGVIHARWVVDKVEHAYIADLVVVEGEDLQERKKALVHGVDAIIALPGGPGTWDELWEMACQRSIGFSGVPIVAINVDGFYDGNHATYARSFVTSRNDISDLHTFSVYQLLNWRFAARILERAHLDGLLYLPPKDIVHFEKDAAAALQWCVAHKDRPAATATALPIKVGRATPVKSAQSLGAATETHITVNGKDALLLQEHRQSRLKQIVTSAALFAAGSLFTLAVLSISSSSSRGYSSSSPRRCGDHDNSDCCCIVANASACGSGLNQLDSIVAVPLDQSSEHTL
eukprot:19712-Heterococcus_DN1.PRE.2